MSSQTSSHSPDQVEEAIEELKIKSESSDDEQDTIKLSDPRHPIASPLPDSSTSDDEMPARRIAQKKASRLHTPKLPQTPQASRTPRTPKVEADGVHEEIVGGEITVKLEDGKPPKLTRNSSKKVIAAPAPLFDYLPDKTTEATSVFEVIYDNIYANKSIGRTDEDIFECECDEEWGKHLCPILKLCLLCPFGTCSYANQISYMQTPPQAPIMPVASTVSTV